MKKFIGMFLRHWRKSPVKISLTVFSVALGTGILVISLSAGAIIRDRVTSGMARDGSVLFVSNATCNSDGSLERLRPVEWDEGAPAKVAAESGAVAAAALVANTPFDEVAVDGVSYRLRSAVGTGPEYFDVFSLKIVAGSPMDARDVNQGSKRVWVSEQLAVILFGSAGQAVGKQVQPPGRLFHRGPSGDKGRNLIPYYAVTGVFATPSEVARRSHGIADLVFPYSAMIPPGMNATFQKRMMSETFVVRTSVASEKKAEAAMRQVLSAAYPRNDGKEVSVAVWEGSSRGASTYLRQLRQTISIFTVSVNILGLVLLVISSLGIFSVMVVELLGRRREIALERAIGASQADVIREFWTWSMALSLLGAVLGVLIALPLSGPVLKTIAPLLGEVSSQFGAEAGLTLPSVIGAVLLALGCGGVLGALPALAAVKGNIADTLREV
jgi:ABC-type antimicrobial peptide transport system permease subunit